MIENQQKDQQINFKWFIFDCNNVMKSKFNGLHDLKTYIQGYSKKLQQSKTLNFFYFFLNFID